MRILIVSDLHYTLKQLDWIASVAAEYEVVVIAGDLLDISSAVDPDAQIAVVLEYLARMSDKTTVVACSGNHDLNARNELDERAAVLARWPRPRRASSSTGRASSWTASSSRSARTGTARARVRARRPQLDEDAALLGERLWLWAYHAPPDDSPTSWTGSRHYGDEDLSAWIARHQPGAVLCGHVHESPFVEGGNWVDQIGSTSVFNAGRQIGPVPAHIAIDTESMLARWSCTEGVEEHALAAN